MWLLALVFRSLDWLTTLLTCRILGWHMWIYRETLHVPYYGTGHEQCLACGLIRVKP